MHPLFGGKCATACVTYTRKESRTCLHRSTRSVPFFNLRLGRWTWVVSCTATCWGLQTTCASSSSFSSSSSSSAAAAVVIVCAHHELELHSSRLIQARVDETHCRVSHCVSSRRDACLCIHTTCNLIQDKSRSRLLSFSLPAASEHTGSRPAHPLTNMTTAFPQVVSRRGLLSVLALVQEAHLIQSRRSRLFAFHDI